MGKRNLKEFIAVLYLLILAFALMIILSGCGQKALMDRYLRDEKEYGITRGVFNYQWWNYYERGRSFAEGQFWEEAIADYKEAIRQRKRDKRRARTYGMHFIEYFPHRELGIAYYNIDRLEDAEKELKASLKAEASAKAKFYLNRVREALLKKEGKDLAPPAIEISEPSPAVIIRKAGVVIEGEAKDDQYVKSLFINDRPLFVEEAAKTILFKEKIQLKEGENRVTIRAEDLTGKTASVTLRLVADRRGPSINISNVADGETVDTPRLELAGSVSDASGVKELKIDEDEVPIGTGKAEPFRRRLHLKPWPNRIELQAADVAGNVTKGSLTVVYKPRAGALPRRRMFGGLPIIRASYDMSGHYRSAVPLVLAATRKKDTQPPTIKLRRIEEYALPREKGKEKVYVTYSDEFFLEGLVTDPGGVAEISVNGEALAISPGKNVFFNHMVPLKEGANELSVSATDGAGNLSLKRVTIERRIPSVHKTESRLTVALLPFQKRDMAGSLRDRAYYILNRILVNQKRFNVVTRGMGLEAILRELKLGEGKLTDPRTAVKAGKLMAAEGMIIGYLNETRRSVEIYALVVDVETSLIMAAEDVYGEDKSAGYIQYLLEGLAQKINDRFPLVEGRVVRVKGDKVIIDVGARQKVGRAMKVIIFEEEPVRDPSTGRLLGTDSTELAEARLNEVQEEMSIGQIVALMGDEKVRVMHHVITK